MNLCINCSCVQSPRADLRGGPGLANGRPPGKAKFANALPPGPTRGKISHSGPQAGGGGGLGAAGID